MTGIGKSLVQSPETADKTFGILCDRLGEITALRGNCTDNGYGTFCSVQVLHHSRALIEGGKLTCQIRREAFLCRHLLQTSGKLTESLGPSGCGVCHDRHVITHITVIFRKCNTCVNGSLTGCNRHVGSVGDQCGTVHHQVSGFRVDQLAEVLKNLCHFVSALATADVDDDICVRPLGDLVLCHGFSGSESAWNCGSASLGNREKSIQDSLSGKERNAGRETLVGRTWNTDRPFLGKCQFFFGSVIKTDGNDGLQNGISTVRNRMDNGSVCDRGRNHGFVKDGGGFLCFSDNRACTDDVTFLYGNVGFPFFFCVKRVNADTTGNIFSRGLGNLCQRSLDTIKNIVDDSRTKENGNSVSCSDNSFSGFQSCSFLKNLYGRHMFLETDNFSNQFFGAYIDHLGDLEAGVALEVDNRTVNTVDNTCFTHVLDLRQI